MLVYRDGLANDLMTWGGHDPTKDAAAFTATVSNGQCTGTVTGVRSNGIVTSVSITSVYGTGTPNQELNFSGGSGMGLTLVCDGEGNVTTTIVYAGSGYQVNDSCSYTDMNINVTINIDSISAADIVDTVTFDTQTGTFISNTTLATTSSSGSGLRVSTNELGQVTGIADGGGGYSVDDTFTIVDSKGLLSVSGDGGEGYVLAPNINLSDNIGVTVVDGSVVLSISDPGSGFTEVPDIILTESASFPNINIFVDLNGHNLVLDKDYSWAGVYDNVHGGSISSQETVKTLTLAASNIWSANLYGPCGCNLISTQNRPIIFNGTMAFDTDITITNSIVTFQNGAITIDDCVITVTSNNISVVHAPMNFIGRGDIVGSGGYIYFHYPENGGARREI